MIIYMELKQENIRISNTVCAGSVQCTSDGNIIVPDTKPDILKIVQIDSDAIITDRSIRDSKLTVSGRVNLKILYIPDCENDTISSIITSFDFLQTINCKGATEGMEILACANILRAEFSVINSRKLHIKNILTIDYEITQTKECEVGTDIIDYDNAEFIRDNINVQSVSEVIYNNFVLQESIELPQGQPNIKELLKTDLEVIDTEYKTVTGRIIVKGTLSLCLLYLTDDLNIEHAELELPFSEVVDSDRVGDDYNCDIDYGIINSECNISQNTDGEMRIINIDTDMSVCACVKESKDIEIIKDCYIPFKKTELVTEEIEIEEVLERPQVQSTLRETVEFKDGAPSVKSVYNVVMKPYILNQRINDKNLNCEGKVEAYILYLSENVDNPIYSIRYEFPFSFSMDINDNSDNLSAKLKASIKHIGYNLNSAGEVELRCIIAVDAEVIKKRNVLIINDITEAEVSDDESGRIVVYFTDKDDEIWEISKRYRVPVKSIMEYNNLSDGEKLKEGMRLFIPN